MLWDLDERVVPAPHPLGLSGVRGYERCQRNLTAKGSRRRVDSGYQLRMSDSAPQIPRLGRRHAVPYKADLPTGWGKSEFIIPVRDYINALESPEVKHALARANAIGALDAYPPVDSDQIFG